MTADFGGQQMILSMVLRAIGLPFIMVPLSLVALKNIRQKETPDASTLTNVMRNLGGAFSIAFIATMLDNKTREHLAHIKESLPNVSQLGWETLYQQQMMFIHTGSSVSTAMQQAQSSLLSTMQQQAAIMAYNDVFFMMTAALAIAAGLMLIMKN